jgi:hypothetical protein
MKKVGLLLAGMLCLLGVGFAQGLSVNSPYLVTEWCIGKNLDINWNLWGDWSQLSKDPGNQKVRIVLVKVNSRSVHRVIAVNAPNSGSFDWTIPDNVQPGEFHVRVATVNMQFKGESEVFTIKSCFPTVHKEMRLDRHPVEPMTQTMTHAVLSIGRIGGKASGYTDSYHLSGRKIRVLIKKAGILFRSEEYTLDAQGSANFEFNHLPMGTYDITVEKVATPVADPASSLNICFQGTTPTQRTATIAAGSTDAAGQDFAIQYAIAFNMQGLCW